MNLITVETLFGLSFLIQLFFWGYAVQRTIRSERNQKNDYHYPVSIIVCAKNEFKNLKELIPLLRSQLYNTFEIIIVDDRSEDDTKKLITENSDINWITISEKSLNLNGKKNALKKAINSAKYNHVLLTDADCRPQSKHWIQLMVESLPKEKGIVLGLSPYYTNKTFTSSLTQFDTCYTALQFTSLTYLGYPYMGLGRNLLYHKSFFQESAIISTYGNLNGGDDDLLINSVGTASNTSICLNKESFCYSYPQGNFEKWIRQKHRHLSVGSYYSTKTKITLSILNFSHLIFTTIFITNGVFLPFSWLIMLGFLLRTSIIFSTFGLVSKTTGTQINRAYYILLDLIHPFYLFAMGGFATVFTKTTWK